MVPLILQQDRIFFSLPGKKEKERPDLISLIWFACLFTGYNAVILLETALQVL